MLIQCKSPFLFYCNISNHSEIKKHYYPLVLDSFKKIGDDPPSDWNCSVKTTFSHQMPFLKDQHLLDTIVWDPMDQMLKEVDLASYPTESCIDEIWANLYEKTNFQEVHNHINPRSLIHFSGIYIIHQKGKNQTSFVHHDSVGYLNTTINTKDLDDIGEGTVMIFPSHLLHYVNPVDKRRCTISFNITSGF
jgi:hypothetical protein